MKDLTMKERAQKHMAFNSFDDELNKGRMDQSMLQYEFNNLPPNDKEKSVELLYRMIGKAGKNVWMEKPIHFDYGYNIEVGDNFYSNIGLTILDGAKVIIGDNVLFGPHVGIYTAGHPIHYLPRIKWIEYAMSITIGNNVWIGGGAIITPNVTIGDNTVIGAGSVVTRNIPSNVLAAGNPCKVIREIADEEEKYYCKNCLIDMDYPHE